MVKMIFKPNLCTPLYFSSWDISEELCPKFNLQEAVGRITLQKVETKEVWDVLQKKYDTEEVGSKKYAVGRYLRYQMTSDRFVEAQSHAIQKIAHEIISEKHSKAQNQRVLTGKPNHEAKDRGGNKKA
ncbi:uncharacterized protein E6C27_scaffold460G00130 [Cucumis melo var. makuwa]|uniref:Uncharacterized protein n=1 Tax=Cucumis melo var. makuwa TaxID=1194695 RepID=A0A5A7TA24_CUCMM|nr:uncharacterized protein E6C27_scaffold460G00130 [Cucumis melo var. makuwa]